MAGLDGLGRTLILKSSTDTTSASYTSISLPPKGHKYTTKRCPRCSHTAVTEPQKHLRHEGCSRFHMHKQPMMQIHETPHEKKTAPKVYNLLISFLTYSTLKSFSQQ